MEQDINEAVIEAEGLLRRVEDDMPLESPLTRSEASILAKLSPDSLRAVELAEARRSRPKKVVKYKRAKGQRHYKRKEATERRKKEKRWRSTPWNSVRRMYGYWAVTKEEWERCLGEVWRKYDPCTLKMKHHRGYGTKDRPYGVYSMVLTDREGNVVYDGNDRLLYDLSSNREECND